MNTPHAIFEWLVCPVVGLSALEYLRAWRVDVLRARQAARRGR